jgi:SAM-dependent methyltransferase
LHRYDADQTGSRFDIRGNPTLFFDIHQAPPDNLVYYTLFSDWKAGEWHYLAMTWSLNDELRAFIDGAFDWAISVATYHHLRDNRESQTALDELRRVLKPGGEAFITVWNRWQPRFWFSRKEVAVPWRTKNKTLERYLLSILLPRTGEAGPAGRLSCVKILPRKLLPSSILRDAPSHDAFSLKSYSSNHTTYSLAQRLENPSNDVWLRHSLSSQ